MIADLKPYPAMKDSGVPWPLEKALRTLEEIRADILALEKESEGLLEIIWGTEWTV